MNKAELIEALAQHYDGSKAEATKALNAVVHTVSASTAAGERVAITGFGVFERVERAARTVRNPRTGEQIQAPATAVPRFRAGTELKAYVSGSRPVPELVVPTAPARPSPVPAPEPRSEPEAPVGRVRRVVANSPANQDDPKKVKKADSRRVGGKKVGGKVESKKASAKKDKDASKKDKGANKKDKKGKGKKG